MPAEDEQQQQSSATPDEQQQQQQSTQQPGATPSEQQSTQSQSQSQSLDELRAELARTAAALKAANKEAETRRKRLAELEGVDEQRRRAEQTELERLQDDHKKATAELETLRAEQKRGRILAAASKRATALSLSFHDGALDDALRLGLIELDEDEQGKIHTNAVDAALRSLAAERPYYVRGTQQQPETDAQKRGGGKGSPDRQSLARRFGLSTE